MIGSVFSTTWSPWISNPRTVSPSNSSMAAWCVRRTAPLMKSWNVSVARSSLVLSSTKPRMAAVSGPTRGWATGGRYFWASCVGVEDLHHLVGDVVGQAGLHIGIVEDGVDAVDEHVGVQDLAVAPDGQDAGEERRAS